MTDINTIVVVLFIILVILVIVNILNRSVVGEFIQCVRSFLCNNVNGGNSDTITTCTKSSLVQMTPTDCQCKLSVTEDTSIHNYGNISDRSLLTKLLFRGAHMVVTSGDDRTNNTTKTADCKHCLVKALAEFLLESSNTSDLPSAPSIYTCNVGADFPTLMTLTADIVLLNIIDDLNTQSLANLWKSLKSNYIIVATSNRNVATIITSVNTNDTVYLGYIGRGGSTSDIDGFFIWKKVSLSIDDLNPEIVIGDYIYDDGKNSPVKFQVVSDHLLLAGTKQRIIADLFKLHPHGIVYAGNVNGFAQVALALGAKMTGSSTTILIPKVRPMTSQTQLALQLGANIIEFEGREASLDRLRTAAASIATKSGMWMPKLGFESAEFCTLMHNAIVSRLPKGFDRLRKWSVWVVGGSGTLAYILHDVFSNSIINVVSVGKKIDWHFRGLDRIRLHIAPQRFSEEVSGDQLPPYPSVKSYDAKVWQFVKKNFNSRDPILIWNVAGNAHVY